MGWVAVVNRAQADLNARMDMNEARRREREFFQQNPAYRDLENIGTETLVGSDERVTCIAGPWPADVMWPGESCPTCRSRAS